MDGMGSRRDPPRARAARRHDGMDGMGSRRAPRLRALLGGMAAWTAWVLGARRARARCSAVWRHGRHGFSARGTPARRLGGMAAWTAWVLGARRARARGSAAWRHGRHGFSARGTPARRLG